MCSWVSRVGRRMSRRTRRTGVFVGVEVIVGVDVATGSCVLPNTMGR